MSKGGDLQKRLIGLVERAVTLATGRGSAPDLTAVAMHHAGRAAIEGPAGPTIPNVFIVASGTPPEPAEKSMAERHLAEVITEMTAHRGWRVDGPVSVKLAPGGRKPEVETAFEVGDLPVWCMLTSTDDDTPITVHHNRALIGRSKDGDVVINKNGVSRKHALLWREAGRVWIADFQSANGTFVNGDRVYDVVEVRRGDLIMFGDTGFVFGMA